METMVTSEGETVSRRRRAPPVALLTSAATVSLKGPANDDWNSSDVMLAKVAVTALASWFCDGGTGASVVGTGTGGTEVSGGSDDVDGSTMAAVLDDDATTEADDDGTGTAADDGDEEGAGVGVLVGDSMGATDDDTTGEGWEDADDDSTAEDDGSTGDDDDDSTGDDDTARDDDDDNTAGDDNAATDDEDDAGNDDTTDDDDTAADDDTMGDDDTTADDEANGRDDWDDSGGVMVLVGAASVDDVTVEVSAVEVGVTCSDDASVVTDVMDCVLVKTCVGVKVLDADGVGPSDIVDVVKLISQKKP
eukprot:Opistho-2@95651